MTIPARTSMVINNNFGAYNNLRDAQPCYYKINTCRNCDTNMTSNTPANQYQRQKIIQNTVRVASSLYTMNLGSLSAYTKPLKELGGVCWNQMSDRPVPSVQTAYVPTGFRTSLNRKNGSVTSSRPGCQSPGGIGCDIKHNSYDRYLNRLKGKGALRRGVIPVGFGVPQIPFNRAYPVYGGKTMKTSIVNNCNCPISPYSINAESKIYDNPLFQNANNTVIKFAVGDSVYAIEESIPDNVKNNIYSKAVIISINEETNMCIIEFEDGTFEQQSSCKLKIYFPCKSCNASVNSVALGSSIYGTDCIYQITQEGNFVY